MRIDIVNYRGPDGGGWKEFPSSAGPVALGHRRLAIIDTSAAGHQPMPDQSMRYWLSYNGEIYNYRELRAELESRGRLFTTQTDSEVLLAAFSMWGASCLDRLRGMFAFLIWDDREKILFAARDRFGIKPIYYARTTSGVAIASEIKQLLGLPEVSGRMNIARAHDFLESGITDHTAETLFADVRQIRPGEHVTITASGLCPALKVERWYRPPTETLRLTEDEAAERFHALLSDSIRLHLRADVPIGSCLSGGLDSSSIVCLVSEQLPPGIHAQTVSAVYPGDRVDEERFVRHVVARTGSVAHFVRPRSDDVFAAAQQLTWHQDEPFGSTSVLAQWCVFDAARRAGVKVMLDGQGADEQLAGYHFAFEHHLSGLLRRGRLLEFVRTLLARRKDHNASISGQLLRAMLPLLPVSAVRNLQNRRQGVMRHGWLNGPAIRKSGNRHGAMTIAAASAGLGRPTDIAGLSRVMTFASNLQMLLHWEDRNSMAHSVEARVPFLDHPLVEFSLALGNEHKMTGSDNKRVLRRAMTDILPEPVLQRRDKIGFATPEQSWFRGPLRDLVHDGVEATLSRFPDLFNSTGVRALRADMLDGRLDIDFTLWRIINLGIWGKKFSVSL